MNRVSLCGEGSGGRGSGRRGPELAGPRGGRAQAGEQQVGRRGGLGVGEGGRAGVSSCVKAAPNLC